MDTKELAEQLTGAQYPLHHHVSKELFDQAKAAGLVIVFGASDDLMEFRGAIYDEVGVYDGGTAFVDSEGLLPDRENIEDDDELQSYFQRQPNAREITAYWDDDELATVDDIDAGRAFTWTYRTEIPHATFAVMEGDEPYCRGIVFALKDAGVPALDESDRQRFEEWVRSVPFFAAYLPACPGEDEDAGPLVRDHEDNGYIDGVVHGAWLGWQANAPDKRPA